tara:strand:- start:7911 stop:9578 length:1668 start_codon:yes stop_codon:yes gene_type:complete
MACLCSVAIAIALLCASARHSLAQPTDAERTQSNAQLSFLDADAGIVISLKLSQLAAAHRLATEVVPKERQAINLAGLGASAILGFYPFVAKAWTTSGFDIKAPLVMQLAVSRRGSSQVRTRAILKARPGDKAQRTIERMRLREKARPRLLNEALSPLFAGIAKTPAEDVLRSQLVAAGVFLVAKPKPLDGLLLAQERDGYIVIDILTPGDSDFAAVLKTIQRRPAALDASMRGAEAIGEGPIGIWIRAAQLANTIERVDLSAKAQREACGHIADLGRNSSIDAMGVRIKIGRKSVSLASSWHLRPEAGLEGALRIGSDPVLAGRKILDAQVHLTSWGALRDRERPKQAKSWDALWANAKACGPSSKVFTTAIAWPELLGLFLSEVSVLHPSAKAAIDGLGGMSAEAGVGTKGSVHITTEAWLRGPAAGVAKAWLRTLFGSERTDGSTYRWGHGAIAPYAIDGKAGSIVGAGYRKGSREMALNGERNIDGQASPQAANAEAIVPTILASLEARPSKLIPLLPAMPGAELWKAWKHASAALHKSAAHIELTIVLRR